MLLVTFKISVCVFELFKSVLREESAIQWPQSRQHILHIHTLLHPSLGSPPHSLPLSTLDEDMVVKLV